MTESASQVPLGCMGLDSIMGYVNKPGCTMTQYGAAGAPPTKRPVTYNNGFDGMFSDMYGIGAVIGMSDAENEARAKKLGEENPQQKLANQLLVDRLGMKDHKGLYAWCHSISHGARAIATGEPVQARVRFDMSGNKLAMLAMRSRGTTCSPRSTTSSASTRCSPPSTSRPPTSCSPCASGWKSPW